jgi:hypothetical protein
MKYFMVEAFMRHGSREMGCTDEPKEQSKHGRGWVCIMRQFF